MISSAVRADSSFVASLTVPFPVANPINVDMGPKQIMFTHTMITRSMAITALPLTKKRLPLDILRHAIITPIPIMTAAIIPIM